MLIQQLCANLSAICIVTRTVHPQVPPKVEYALTKWGQAMCPALDELLEMGGVAAEARGRGNARREAAPASDWTVSGGASFPYPAFGKKTQRLEALTAGIGLQKGSSPQ